MMRSLAFLLIAVLTLSQAVRAADSSAEDVRALLQGVKEITAPGLPGSLIAFGPQARAVVAGGHGEQHAVVVCARWQDGRVVAWAHDGYLNPEALSVGDTGRLMLNAVAWTAGKKGKPRVGVLNNELLRKWLQQERIDATSLSGPAWFKDLGRIDVLIAYAPTISTAEARAEVKAFITGGGGLVAADTGWGWAQLHPGQSLVTDHPGNQLLYPAGLLWTGGFSERTSGTGFKTGDPLAEGLNAGAALDALLQQKRGGRKLTDAEQAQCVHSVTLALSVLPRQDTVLLGKLRQARDQAGAELMPTPKKPIQARDGLVRAFVALDVHDLQTLPAGEIKAHPAAVLFPGAVPANARVVDRKLSINTAIPDWHSTGLYAPPGKVLTVGIPATAASKGLRVRIGSHSDTIWDHKTWRRLPEVCRSWPLAKETQPVANGLGGLVYVEVPAGSKLGTVEVRIVGAVEAPLFVLGQTSRDEWIDRQSKLPGPWAELATSKLILTVPSRVVRELRDPEQLMKTWDQVMDASADLARIPHERRRPERFVLDEQISAGYMHSGYPLMAHLDVEKNIVDARKVAKGEDTWGFFHEIGHNHQSPDWTFDGTTEVTVNLFTMYAHEKVCKRADMGTALVGMLEADRSKKVKDYLARGAKFADWKSDPFLALCMYIQLQQAFGWQTFQDVFEEYRKLPPNDRPRTDDEKRDQWMVRFSKRVNRNLGPFFQAWGVPTSAAARAKIKDLPGWIPDNFPPK